jgi:hypothetical protein
MPRSFDANPEIASLEDRLRQAQLGADVATLDELIPDDLLFTGPDGQLATKAQDIEAHRSRTARFHEHERRSRWGTPAGASLIGVGR